MTTRLRALAGLLFIAMIPACSKPPPAAEPETQTAVEPAVAPSATPAPPVPEAPPAPAPGSTSSSPIIYACDDGSGLMVTYDKYSALVKLPTGSTALPRAESASKGGGAVYVGEELSLYRDGNRVQLQSGGTPRTCTESPAGG